MSLQEAVRLEALKSFEVLDTAPDEALDRIVQLASDLFEAPIAMISLIDEDRQWFKARIGLQSCETPREQAFCAHAVDLGPDAVMVIENAAQDTRFAHNPLVTGPPTIRFYAGATLTTRDGHNLGTLCVIDDKPRCRPDDAALDRLKSLARMAVDHFEQAKALRLTQQKQRLLEIAESMSGVGHWRLDVSRNTVTWSDAVYQIHGVDRETFDPSLDDAIGFYHPDDREMVQDHIAKAIESKTGFDFRLRLIRSDGALRHVTSRGVCEVDPKGRVTAVIGLFQDITETVETIDTLNRRKQRYRLLTEHAGDVIASYDFRGRGQFISPAIEKLLGYSVAETADLDVPGVLHPDERQAVMAAFTAMSQGLDHQTVQHRSRHKRGHYVWVESNLQLVRDKEGAPRGIVSVSRDISDRKALEFELIAARDDAREQAQRALLAEDIAGVGYWRFDLRTRHLDVSRKMFEIYGLEVVERPQIETFNDLIHPDDRAVTIARIAERLRTGEADYNVPTRIVRPDGQVRCVAGSSIIEKGSDGKSAVVMGTVRDITDEQRVQADLKRARAEAEAATAVKAEFLSNMSHELRTPLTAVLGFSRLIENQPELSPATRRYVDRVMSAGKALLATVNDILDFSKLEAGQVEIHYAPASPRQVLEEALDLFSCQAQEKGVILDFQGADDLPPVLDLAAERLRQVLLNLIGNAVKFTEEGKITLRAVWRDEVLQVSVTDTGPGIADDRKGRLFQRFSQVDGSSTRRHGGTGLGLAICKGLIEAMGGRIGVTSREGVGSTFWFETPATKACLAPPEQGLASTGLPEGCRVLVVDDNPANRDLVSAVLSVFGAEITEAGDGETAITLAQDRPFDVILMDLRMPGMGGAAAAAEIRLGRVNGDAPIIAFSADASVGVGDMFDGVVAKPLTLAALIGEINRALALRQGDPVA